MELASLETWILIGGGLLSSLFSAVGGLGGGLVLYFLLLLFFPLGSVIPLHGMVMLASNLSRFVFLRHHLHHKMALPQIASIPLGAIIGAGAVTLGIPERFLFFILLLLVIYSLFKPKKLPEVRVPYWGYFWVGLGGGVLGSLIGATGSYTKVFYNRSDLSRQQIVCNESWTQVLIHFCKIPVFFYLGFEYQKHSALILFGVLAAILGSWIGVRILNIIPQKVFYLFYRLLLLGAGLKLLSKITPIFE